MINYPEMIGGTTDRLDTDMMRAGEGRLISKVGAEGVYTVGALPCAEWPSGLGLALKIEGWRRDSLPPNGYHCVIATRWIGRRLPGLRCTQCPIPNS